MNFDKGVGNMKTIYNCTFYKEVNSDGSFYVPGDSQPNLIY